MTMKGKDRDRVKPVRDLGGRIVEGLTELRDALANQVPLEQRFTVRTVEVPDPEAFDARRIRAVRSRLGMSQHIFARVLGVSAVLVQSWEQGVRVPAPIARRLLTEMERDPHHWQKLVSSTPAPGHGRRKSA